MVKVREKSELVTVNVAENFKKLMDKNFVRPTKHSTMLPYFEELEIEADKNFQNIINGMMAAYLTENVVEATEYIDMFNKYLCQFGLRITKQTFLNLVRFFYEVLIKKDQNIDLIKISCLGLSKMITATRNASFGYRDLCLDWKPLYDLLLRAIRQKIKPDISQMLKDTVTLFSIFYEPKEHGAIWETLLEEMTIGSRAMDQFMTLCRVFLTVEGMSEEEAKKYAVSTWVKEIWDLYLKADMNTSWTSVSMDLISDFCYYHPGAYDFSPHYDVLFTKMMRSFELTVRGGKMSLGDGQEIESNTHLATICVYTIGGPNSSLPHFQRLMRYILFNVHPLNVGEHTDQIASFLKDFITRFKSRLTNERLRFKKRECSREYYLMDSDIDAVTESLTDLAIMLMFSNQQDYKLIHCLTTINRELVASKLLEHFYSSITAVSEPHRLSVIIEAFSNIIFEIIRPADPEYRTPRDISFDSTWLKTLEEERKSWSTYRSGSECAQVKSHQFKSLRAHAFYIMEILINNINVSDVDRTNYIFKTLTVLFSSFPLMDFSSAPEFHKLSEDDRIICLLSKRIPHLVEFTIDKLLEVITCLSVVAPKTSGQTVGASVSSESLNQVGEEEVVLVSGVSQLVKVIFERVDEKLRKNLFDRLFAYITSCEFSSDTATRTLTTLVMAAVWVSPAAFRHYAEFVSKKLKALITEEIRESRSPPSSVIFFVELARGLFAATHEMIVENEKMLSEVVTLMLSCQSTRIHKLVERFQKSIIMPHSVAIGSHHEITCGTFGVTSLLSTLLYIETEPNYTPENAEFKRPLSQWNPIYYWAKCTKLQDSVISWHIPSKTEVECAQRMANQFFFPFIAKLMDMDYDRDKFRRSIHHIMMVMKDVKSFRHPSNRTPIPDIYTPFCLPIPSSSLGTACILEFELKGPNGENARELMVKMIENVSKKIQDPTTLAYLSIIASGCLGKTNFCFEDKTEAFLNEPQSILVDLTYGKAVKVSQHTLDRLAESKRAQTEMYHNYEVREANEFDERILRSLLNLAMNDYEKVRDAATLFLKQMDSQLFRFRHKFLPAVLDVLTTETNNMDRLAGAMSLVITLGWAANENPRIRIDVWDAILRIKVFDELKICVLFDSICNEIETISKRPNYWKVERGSHEDRNKKVAEVAQQLIKPSEPSWDQYLTPESLKIQTDTWFNYQKARESSRSDLTEILFAKHVKNPAHHHTRENLARTMTFQSQKEQAEPRTIALLLSQLSDDQYNSRKEAREWLSRWLYETKPKSNRIEMSPPTKRVDHGVSLESGIREDNLWLAYDYEHLPNTPDKWDDMIFVEKQQASCRWRKTISVVRKRKDGPPLASRQLTPSDRLIIDYFSQPDLISNLLKTRLIEKEDHILPYAYFWKIFKYVVRNYPDKKKPLELLIWNLRELLKSKKRNEQLLAVELFLGIVEGLKHRPFSELNEFWKEITVALDQFFNIMVLDAEPSWNFTIVTILNGDARRHWWFLESLIGGARKTNGMTEFQQAFRLSSLIFKGWQHGEIMKRVSLIAWKKLQTTVTDSLRFAIGSVFRATAQICEKNSTATLINIPPRFLPDSLDSTIQKIIEKIPHLKLVEDPESARNCQSDTAISSPKNKRRRRSSINDDLRDRESLIYFRTLLEIILQYYETSTQSWAQSLVKILPKLMEYANEDDYDVSEETYRDVDITQNSAIIIHDYMSVSWLRSEFIDGIVNNWLKTFSSHSDSSRVRLAIIKFVQASVYSNMYPMCLKSRREKVEHLLFKAVFDSEISIRNEAAKCLLLFIHCEYIHVSDERIEEFSRILHSKTSLEANSHGAALALGALVLAYPFSLPNKILKPLRILSSTTSKRAIVHKTMTETVREFRRQHRDDWHKTKEILGESLVFDIENATAPAYYA